MPIYVRMRGGLGNQMFQYAYAYTLLKSFPELDTIVLDVREYQHYSVRFFELDSFCLDGVSCFFSSGDLKYDFRIKFFRLYQRIYRDLCKNEISEINERRLKKGYIFGTTFSALPQKIYTKDLYLYGYFQDYKIFDQYKAELKKLYYIKEIQNSPIRGSISSNSVAISIRLGKDIQNLKWTVYTEDYYQKAINLIIKKHFVDQIVVYSDNVDFVKKNNWFSLTGLPIVYVERLRPAEQISLMQASRDYIISNSTFAWWGAYLGQKDDSIIVAPKSWQGNKKMKESRLFLPTFTFVDEE